MLFNLSSNGAAINLTNRSVRVYALKPDGREIFNDLVVSDPVRGTCILELTNQMLAIPGVVKMELMITEGLKKLTSFEFELEIIKSLNNETAIVSTNEFTALIKALASLNEYDNYKNEIKAARGSFMSILLRLNDSDTKKANNIDNSRTTTAKDVTGAINELNANKMNNTKGTASDAFQNLYIEGLGSVKEIVSSGGTENDYWVKFADGSMECIIERTFKGNVSTPWGTLYESAVFNLGSFPQLFVSKPKLSYCITSSTAALVEFIRNTTTSAVGETAFSRPTQGPDVTITISIIAKGRWK